MSLSPEAIILALNQLPPEVVSLGMFLLCGISVLLLLRYLGLQGLYMYVVVAAICSNIQVLKATKFAFYPDPIALGTILFTSTYMCTDIISEHFGAIHARRAVWLSFTAMLLTATVMIITLGWQPVQLDITGEGFRRFKDAHDAMAVLFTPAPAIFFASITAFLISQHNDIWIFQLIRRLSGDRYLWLRSSVSTMVSSLIDNIIFSTLAWFILAPSPVDFRTLVFTYILGTYAIRVVVAVLNTPFVYWSKKFLPPDSSVVHANV